jgi:hypothetical protein
MEKCKLKMEKPVMMVTFLMVTAAQDSVLSNTCGIALKKKISNRCAVQ